MDNTTCNSCSITGQNITEEYDETYQQPIELISIFFTLRVLESCVGIIFNVILLIVIWNLGWKAQPTYILIASLGLAEVFINLPAGLSLTLAILDIQEDRGLTWTIICGVHDGVFSAVGVWTIMWTVFLISLDRLVSVSSPLWYIQRVSYRSVLLAVAAVWLWGIIHALMAWPYIYLNAADSQCEYQYYLPRGISSYYMFVFLLLFAFNVLMFMRICYVAYQRSRSVSSMDIEFSSSGVSVISTFPNNAEKSQNKRLKQQNKILEMMVTVLALFLIMYLPAAFVSFFKSDNPPVWYQWIYYFTFLLFYANSLVNPWLYAWKNTDIRKGFKRVLGCI